MLDRIRSGPAEPVAAAAVKMSRRKQACPSRTLKAVGDPSAIEEGDTAAELSASAAAGSTEKDTESAKETSLTESNNVLDDSLEPAPLVIITDIPSPHLPSKLDDTPPPTEDDSPKDKTSTDPALSPGLDIPPSEPTPLTLALLPSSPPSPDHPSTPSSINSSSGQDGSSSKQRRGKKIMPVPGDDGKSRWQCPICKEQLGSDHDFTVHIRSHNTTQAKQPNTCTICGKVLSSQSSLDRHMLVHSGERPFKCKVCQMSFTTNGNMHRHSRIHTKEDLKAASLNEGGRGSKSSGRNSSTPKSSLSGSADFSPSSASLNGGATGSMSSWHRPSIFSPDRSAPVSGVDLQKLLSPDKLMTPSHLPFSSVHGAFMSSVGLLPHILENGKRMLPQFSNPDVKPNKTRKVDAAEKMESPCPSRLPASVTENQDVQVQGKTSIDKEPASRQARSPSKRRLHQRGGESNAAEGCSDVSPHRAQDECHWCGKTFLGRYGLEQHILQHHHDLTPATDIGHSDYNAAGGQTDSDQDTTPYACTSCQLSFSTQQEIVFHNLLQHHTNQEAERAFADALAGDKNGMTKIALENALDGFSDINFVDFTSQKFVLVAKAECENVRHKATSQIHNHTCEDCDLSFPSSACLSLHRASHKPNNWTKCTLCDCHFIDYDQLNTHMNKHASDRAFEEAVESDKENSGEPKSMGKKSFMAMMGLVSKDEVSGSRSNEEIIENISKEQNNHYFPEIFKMFASKKALEEGSLDNNKDNSIPSTSAQKTPSKSSTLLSASALTKLLRDQDSVRAAGLMQSYKPSGKKDLSGQRNDLSTAPLLLPEAFASLNSPSSLLRRDADDNGNQKKGTKVCQYCGSTFFNDRALKGHVRTHLGLSPYKCQFCSYSSADKSTLIRHMRTHNGHRPFKCNFCQFPFTTKANCERHVKKRHGVTSKEEMDKSVSYESFPTDPTDNFENFQSPDTVCKFCGEDFKFFRALKNHLKTHSSSHKRPFTCTKCLAEFSMKANAIRHVQKQHPDVAHKDIENFILTNDLQGELDDDICYDTSSLSPSSTPGASGQDFVPPKAHSTPIFSTMGHTHDSARSDVPLDFSLRNSELTARLSGMFPAESAKVEMTTEQPIDLTTKRKSSSPNLSAVVSCASSLSMSAKSLAPGSAMSGEVACSLCEKTFSSKEAAQQHLVTVHQVNPAALPLPSPASDSNNNSGSGGAAQLAALLAMGMINPLQYQTQLSLFQARAAAAASGVFQAHPAFSHLQPKLAYLSSSASHLPKALLADGGSAGVKKEPGTAATSSSASGAVSSGSESSCDLASVNKIIESTTSQNLQIFLKPQATNSGSDDSEPHATPWESGDEDSDQSLEQLYKQSLNGAIKVKMEAKAPEMIIDDDDDEEDEDEDEDEMEDSRLDEEDGESDLETNDSDNRTQFSMGETQGDLSETNGYQDEDSQMASDQAGSKSDSGLTVLKKKRNSYADSPHKLRCPECPRSFPWVSSLNRHMLTHTGQKPFKCPRCQVTFSTKSNRERHLIRKHGVNMLDPASRQTMDRPYKCHLCVFSSFSTESNLLKHYKERHPGCNPPDRYLMKMEQGEIDDLGQQLDKLDEAALAKLDSSALDAWSENASMDTDDIDTPCTSGVKTPVPTVVENVVASLLKREARGSPALVSTPEQTYNGLEDNEDDADDATTSLAMNGSAERHINPERDNYNVDKITYCWKCGEQFNSRKLLVRHLKEHNIDLPFKCYLCDASYDSRHECLVHQEKAHSTDWSVLKEKNSVDSIETYAERLDRIVERNCKSGIFGEDGEEAESVALATEEGQTEMVASDYLQRKVYCSLCSKRFWSLQDLRRHMRSHTGERPFECDKCHKRFTLKHSMMRHRRKHTSTGNANSPTILSEEEDELQAMDTSGKSPAANMGSGHQALRQHLAASVVTRTNGNIPTAVTEGGEAGGEEKDDGEDILHNLLGVESATIDQIMDSAASAASLLGVTPTKDKQNDPADDDDDDN